MDSQTGIYRSGAYRCLYRYLCYQQCNDDKAFNPEVEISVDAGCCAGVTPQSHKTALDAMKGCQIRIE